MNAQLLSDGKDLQTDIDHCCGWRTARGAGLGIRQFTLQGQDLLMMRRAVWLNRTTEKHARPLLLLITPDITP